MGGNAGGGAYTKGSDKIRWCVKGSLKFLTMSVIYCYCVCCPVRVLILGDHHRDFQRFKPLTRKSYADVTAIKGKEKVD